ncbi:MAG: AAA family ATPase [Terriglobia bacterium]
MKLESVGVKGFRSIESCTLEDCGSFNVLIGKNNSGKSNMLSAINAFFMSITTGDVVTIDPPLGKEIDFFRKRTESPIEISLTFMLSLAERDTLIQDIITHAPQVKTAIEGIDPSLRLIVAITVISLPHRAGYVSKISLEETEKSGSLRVPTERIILSVSPAAAMELYQRTSVVNQKFSDAAVVHAIQKGFDSDDWTRYREAMKQPRGVVYRTFARRFGLLEKMSSEVRNAVDQAIGESTSLKDCLDVIQALAARIEEEGEHVQRQGLNAKIRTFSGEEATVPTYVTNLVSRISKMKVLHLGDRRKPIGPEEAEKLLSLKITRGGDQILHSVQETVSALLGVKIDAFRSTENSASDEVSAEMDVGNFLVEANGSGIREALRLILDVEFEHPDILLVEEPEIHLHPALETSLMRYLKRISSSCQVFLTTHSTNFLDTTDSKNQCLVSRAESTQVQLLDREEAEAQLPRELGIRLSSLFMYDRLVFVEGPTDEDVLRECASKLNVNFGQANVGFVHMGGARNFTHFAAEATISFLSKRQVRIWFLMDRDEKEDSEVAKLKDRVGAAGTVVILKGRELENFLLCPRAIAEFIHLKKIISGNLAAGAVPSEIEIRNALDQCADGLKQDTVDKRVAKLLCKPIYPSIKGVLEEQHEGSTTERIGKELDRLIREIDSIKARAATVYEEQSSGVDNAWNSHKLSIVPGDELLDCVCRRYDVRFKKEFGDGVRLARLMHEDEINTEIAEFIHLVGSD